MTNKLLDYIYENKILTILIVGLISLGIFHYIFQKPVQVQSGDHNQIRSTDIRPIEEKKGKVEKTSKAKEKAEFVMVDIQGAVKTPGVYRLKGTGIVRDAIRLAGGPSEDAELKQINQAQHVTDEMQIIVPRIGEVAEPNAQGTPTNNQSSGKKDSKGKVNINSATVNDFQGVSGIGPKKAEKIIDYRTKNGNFSTLEDLTKVSGIGDKTLESLRDQLTI
ncbi:helix-hairpin-helix domain-containing protein [Companilactobacillus hulinensis]|uniref:helix-hairpin-helix domain-containing protein n=1 Tax=Companilactobacillus hulinensis TaxID=2486007 RepID=UPI000F77BCAB|nr:helix-hairpin-helix domain-containing protein [Companilactobacillus hulinensis]